MSSRSAVTTLGDSLVLSLLSCSMCSDSSSPASEPVASLPRPACGAPHCSCTGIHMRHMHANEQAAALKVQAPPAQYTATL
eukprot:19117-Heterococcus_DN1.PRE.2